ncbi:MAG: type VI secretion system lipoprotein TssJ [Planctomycetes bacterium]|jgi:type VI secretion system VasD/TssJ family lipoprotein|nr:type VI secretion system lipoprotein TssJ [Planctomycetota bacterium]MCC7063764.1 type VI secretion system lipoprotein TssJ [Planctomycetota bacterium]
MTRNLAMAPTGSHTPRPTLRTGLGITFACWIATACASGPYAAELLAEGGPKLNPTFDDKPSAVNIRILPLKDKEAFDNATLADLRSDPPNLAAGTWVPPHKDTIVYVGQKNWIEVEVKPEVRFFGIYGLFNDDSGTPRAVIGVDELAGKKLVLDGFQITLTERGTGDSK